MIVVDPVAGRCIRSGGRPPRRFSSVYRPWLFTVAAVATYPDSVQLNYTRQRDLTEWAYFFGPLAAWGGNSYVAYRMNRLLGPIVEDPQGGVYFNLFIRATWEAIQLP